MMQTSPETVGGQEPGYAFGAFRLEPDGTLWRGDLPVHITPKELTALRYLLSKAGQLVSLAELKEAIWGSVHVTADSLPRCMSSLRARLGEDGYIQTVYKRGYRMMAMVRRLDTAGPPGLLRLAIMPFRCEFGLDEHLGTLVSEQTAARLTMLPSPAVSVLARDSVFVLAGRGMSARDIGEALKADLVLTGTVYGWASQYRLRAEVLRVHDGIQIWADDLLVPRNRPAALEAELIERLTLRLGGGRAFNIATRSDAALTQSSEARAYELYLRGHSKWNSAETRHMQDGAQLLLQAIEINPNLLAARVDLIQASVLQCLCGFISSFAAAEQIRREAKAIEDSGRVAPGILLALGWVSFHVDRDLRSATRFYSAASHLPHDQWTTRMRTLLALSRHRFNDGIEILQAALRNDPFAPWLHARLAWALHLAGRKEESLEQAERCLNMHAQHEAASLYAAIILAFQGHTERSSALARDLRSVSPHLDIAAAVHAYALVLAGKSSEARTILEHLEWLSRERFVMNAFTPAVYAALGDTEGALTALRSCETSCCPWFFQMLADPRLESLHGHPEFQRMQRTLVAIEAEAREAAEAFC